MFGLDYEVSVTLAILMVAIVLLASQKIRIDLVALLVMISLIVSGVLTPEETFAAFKSWPSTAWENQLTHNSPDCS
jgi:di/tricarboxylate transporter